jgi:hypothetical protein
MKALESMNAALAGKKEIQVDVANLLKTEPVLRDQLVAALKSGKTEGPLRLNQPDYKDQGSRFAYGGLDMRFKLDPEHGTVKVSANDKYKWSPGSSRVSQCLHKMSQSLVDSGEMSVPSLTGSTQTSLSDLGIRPANQAPKTEPIELP